MNPTIEAVTDRIRARSAKTRGDYLARVARAVEAGPARAHLSCGNMAHVTAAMGPDKQPIAEERGGRGVFVRGLTEVEVSSEAEALNLLYSGQLARTTAQHKLNRTSNRSHSIFTIVIQQQSRSGVSERVVTSKLNLVDLAGSERLKKTMESSDGASVPIDATLKKESMYINQSLTYLEQCVVALGRRGGGHVAYRQTKLTNVLKDSLGGRCSLDFCLG